MSKAIRHDSERDVFETNSVGPASTVDPEKPPLPDDRLEVIEQELVPDDRYEEPAKRTLVQKLFGIGYSGWFQLVVVCIFVGAILQAGGVDFFSPNFTVSGFLTSFINGALSVMGWAIGVGWAPLLSGALVVIPLWLAWRLLSVPFRH
jgi:hypothetical protein